MITKNEISSLNLSPTKKDFVQIWNELMEVASKITERWDPTSTNESDPGIVLLKVLTGIADKLNYNIDKNILEAFMPTAAQMESMRKLCELVGYDIKYYQSAETTVRVRYTGDLSENDEKLPEPGGLQLPKFTTITNADKDITFVTTNTVPAYITNSVPWVDVPCIEGQISQCESINENNLITLAQLNDDNKYYLPEIQIAENGIFVYNAAIFNDTYVDGTPWEQVSNLNTRSTETRVFKFGYDSFEGRPYLAFPDDVGSLIGDGLFIYFVRTSGLNGNITARKLEVLEVPTDSAWENYSAEQFEVVNVDATTNGANIESISAAYNNFKKTVGTFDTLVTCRDYMNKIYSLMDASNSPYVSNILVTDIRNDINNAITLCSCNEYGILYKETPRVITTDVTSTTTASDIKVIKATVTEAEVETENGVERVNRLTIENNVPVTVQTEVPLIDHFDLLLYPFKTFTQVSSGAEDLITPYNKSFTYTEQMNREIEASLADLKTCAHNLTTPDEGDIVAINNYLRLNAFIATSTKVSETEAKDILLNVKVALVNEFNLRNLDFGEKIPFDSILTVIENADSRIKVVSLQEPAVLTTYSIKEEDEDGYYTSREYGIASATDDEIFEVLYKDENETEYQTAKGETAKDIYNKLMLRNILAGRASLFAYDETFIPNNFEKPYTITKNITSDLKLDDSSDAGLSNEAKAIKEEVNNIDVSDLPTDSTDSIVLTSPGLNGGIVTLNVVKDKEGTITKEVYETYTPSFIFAVNPDGSLKQENGQPVVDETAKDSIIKDITRVEAVCEISSKSEKGLFNNITLAKNEVIKFRAPNLITTKTFPAYVYYRFEHGNSTANATSTTANKSTDGSFAKAMTLSEFINQDSVKAVNFFEKLWGNAGIGFSNEDYTFEAEPVDASNPKIPSPGKLAEIFNAAIAVEAEDPLDVLKKDAKPDDNGQYSDDQFESVNLFFGVAALTKAVDDHFTIKGNTQPVRFRYFPLTYHTSSIWSSCIKEFDASLPDGPDGASEVLWQLSSTSSHPKGKLVLESGKKLIGLDGDSLTFSSVGELVYICTDLGSNPDYSVLPDGSNIELRSGDKLYIHYTPSSTNEEGETENAEEVSIVYEGGGEMPVIIKPSGFVLMDSDDVHRQGTSWKKTDVLFNGEPKNLFALAPNEQLEMRSISEVVLDKPARFYKNFDNDELETGNIDKVISYELKDGEYLFYTDQSTQDAAYYGSGSVITLDKGARIPKVSEKIEVSEILKQGLHIIPWSSVVLLNSTKKVTVTEYQYITLTEGDTLNTLTVDTEDADNRKIWNNGPLTLGSGGANWIKCDQKNPITYTPAGAETSKKLPEISLTPSSSRTSLGWEVCSFLELSTSPGYAQQLRATSASSADGKNTTASITNKVNVYVAAKTGERLAATIKPEETEIPGVGKIDEPVSIKLSTIAQAASGNFKKSNKKADDIDDTDDTDETDDINIQLKVFKEEAPTKIYLDNLDDITTPITPISSSNSLPVEVSSTSINNYWSKIDVSKELWRTVVVEETETDDQGNSVEVLKEIGKPNALQLNFMIPENSDLFGIFSIYLKMSGDKQSNTNKPYIPADGARVFIDIPSEFGQNVISIFNNRDANNNDTWWSGGIATTKSNRFYLRAGLNCIKIAKSCSLLLKAEPEAGGSILYDNMRLIKGIQTNGINLKLLDPDTTFNAEETRITEIENTRIAEIKAKEEQTPEDKAELEAFENMKDAFKNKKIVFANKILKHITDLDKNHEFYYNAPIENSLAIEFDENINSFSNPYTLYDINNINNSFVVSKLDVKYLNKGLKIAKSSRY